MQSDTDCGTYDDSLFMKRKNDDDDKVPTCQKVRIDEFSFEPMSPDYPPPGFEPSLETPASGETESDVKLLKSLTASVVTDFTYNRQRIQNYGYDFKVLNYFDVTPNYDDGTIQRQAQPVLRSNVNGASIGKNTESFADEPGNVYDNDDDHDIVNTDVFNNNPFLSRLNF